MENGESNYQEGLMKRCVTRKMLFGLLLTLTLAGYANSQTVWTENLPPAGSAHSMPTRLFPTDNWWNLKISQAPLNTKSASYERWVSLDGPLRTEIALAFEGLTFNDFEAVKLGWQPIPTPGGSMTLVDSGSGLRRKVTVESTGLFRLVFEAADNWGIAQWYDLVNDPSAQTNLTGPGYGVTNDISTAEPGLFQQVFYGTNPNDPKLYTRAAAYYFPNSPRTFNILENSASRVVVQAISSPVVNAVGVLSNVTAEVTYYIYPNGKIYVHSVLRVAAAQTASEWRCATLGLSDPTSVNPYAGPDSTGWIRSSTTQNPYDYVGAAESYIFAYWRASTTPAPYTNFTKASVLLVPRPRNPNQGTQGRHNWSGWKRWYYGNVSLNMAEGQSLTQDYLIQLGTQGSSVLPNINSSTVASPIAQAYFANPTPPPASSPSPSPSPTPTPTASIKINFQPAAAAVPSGYVADTGVVYGDCGNGYSYGWDQSTIAVDRNAANSPDQRYDTLSVWWASTSYRFSGARSSFFRPVAVLTLVPLSVPLIFPEASRFRWIWEFVLPV
jgi:hypothetical protein